MLGLVLAFIFSVSAQELMVSSIDPRTLLIGETQSEDDLARIDEVEAFYEHLERILIQIDFYDPRTPRAAMRRLRRLFNRVNMDETEVGMLRGILTAIGKKIGNQP